MKVSDRSAPTEATIVGFLRALVIRYTLERKWKHTTQTRVVFPPGRIREDVALARQRFTIRPVVAAADQETPDGLFGVGIAAIIVNADPFKRVLLRREMFFVPLLTLAPIESHRLTAPVAGPVCA